MSLIRKSFILLLLSFGFLLSLNLHAAGSGYFVGNGGEVIRWDEVYYVRDLFEYGVHLQPYVGSRVDPDIRKAYDLSNLNTQMQDIGVDSEILLKKMTDLEELSKGFGFYVLKALEYYTFRVVETPLGRLVDSTPILVVPDEDRLLAANRFMGIIRLANGAAEPIWTKLSAEHRVALMIHEGLYSLTRVQLKDGVGFQDPLFSREVVGRLFSELDVQVRREIPIYLKDAFMLPQGVQMCQNRYGLRVWQEGLSGIKNGLVIELENPLETHLRTTFVRQACQLAHSTQRWGGLSENVIIEMSRLSFYSQVVSYTASFGLGQVAITLLPQAPIVHERLMPGKSLSHCEWSLAFKLLSFYDGSIPQGYGGARSSCQSIDRSSRATETPSILKTN